MPFSLSASAVMLLLFIAASAPGWWLAARGGYQTQWQVVSGGFASYSASLLLTGLIALPSPGQVPVLPVHLAAIGIVALACGIAGRRMKAGQPGPTSRFDPVLAIPAIVATLAAIVILDSGADLTPDGLAVRGWFSADFYKHLGHVNALANLGLMPRDIFGAGAPLAYYWLVYVGPASAASVTGDPMGALAAFIVVQTFFFWLLIPGLIRAIGVSRPAAVLLALLAWATPTMEGLILLALTGFDWPVATGEASVAGVWNQMMGTSGLFRLNYVIPQHQLMLAGLLSWFGLFGLPSRKPAGPVALLAHAPLAAAAAISTIFGAICLSLYGLVQLFDRHLRLRDRFILIGATGVAAVAILFLLGVLDPSLGGGTLSSPLFGDQPDQRGYLARFVQAIFGAVPLLGVLLLLALLGGYDAAIRRRSRADNLPLFIAVTLFAGLAIMITAGVFVENRRFVHELQLRTSLVVALAIVLAVAWLIAERSRRRVSPTIIAGGIALGVATGLPTLLVDFAWHINRRGADRQLVPADDLAILETIQTSTPPDAVIEQFPENPVMLGGGRDQWVPILAGRTVPSSTRATDWAAAAKGWAATRRFYANQAGAAPDPRADYVYLSRILHPQSFDALAGRLDADRGWSRIASRPDAALFERKR